MSADWKVGYRMPTDSTESSLGTATIDYLGKDDPHTQKIEVHGESADEIARYIAHVLNTFNVRAK